ncbi:MAG TPA: PLP-dependent aminotransferase family protein, partial [Bacteroidales bacterium]|nr:PLP-dependent aminotransferase family protein [Bacteroidales bacterium]
MEDSVINEHIYLQIAGVLEKQIINRVLKTGDKLPSVRIMSKEQGVSVSTILHAYYHLESKGLIETRPQSGYFVRFSPRKMPGIPQLSYPEHRNTENNAEDLIAEVYKDIADDSLIKFSLSVPSQEFLPTGKLNKIMVEAMRSLPANGIMYENIQGNENLRRQIARWSMNWGSKLRSDDIVTTAGCMNALAFALMAVTEKGDTIATESPCYFGILQLANNMGLKVLELPTHAAEGVDMQSLKKVLAAQKVKALVLISNFSNPLTSCIPDDHKKEIVSTIQRYNIPLIEDDIYGDVYFGDGRPKCCKSFDESGLVLWCGSVSKTLAPGYRVGWIAPGKYLEKVRRLKMYHAVASTTIQQEAVAMFLENGRYEHHLRKLRNVLHANSLQYIRAISEYFPDDTRISRPQGGFLIWMELNKKADTYKLYQRAMQHKISISPGRMFTLQDQYNHCL